MCEKQKLIKTITFAIYTHVELFCYFLTQKSWQLQFTLFQFTVFFIYANVCRATYPLKSSFKEEAWLSVQQHMILFLFHNSLAPSRLPATHIQYTHTRCQTGRSLHFWVWARLEYHQVQFPAFPEPLPKRHATASLPPSLWFWPLSVSLPSAASPLSIFFCQRRAFLLCFTISSL